MGHFSLRMYIRGVPYPITFITPFHFGVCQFPLPSQLFHVLRPLPPICSGYLNTNISTRSQFPYLLVVRALFSDVHNSALLRVVILHIPIHVQRDSYMVLFYVFHRYHFLWMLIAYNLSVCRFSGVLVQTKNYPCIGSGIFQIQDVIFFCFSSYLGAPCLAIPRTGSCDQMSFYFHPGGNFAPQCPSFRFPRARIQLLTVWQKEPIYILPHTPRSLFVIQFGWAHYSPTHTALYTNDTCNI